MACIFFFLVDAQVHSLSLICPQCLFLMSSLIPPSPSRRRRYEALKQISWTLDNAENRVTQLDASGTDETASEDDMIVEYELVDEQNYIAYQELEEDEDMQMTQEIKDDDVDMQLTQEITYNKPVKDAGMLTFILQLVSPG